MSRLAQTAEPSLDLKANVESAVRRVFAIRDLQEGLSQWRLGTTLGWLDIKLRYRGSVIGPFWLTLSTAVMVIAMGVLYAELFHMELHDYMPFLALSLVLWNALSAMVGDACVCFTSAEGMIRAVRMPFTIYAVRAVVRNGLVLGHNIVVILGVFLFFDVWPGGIAAQSLLGMCFWVVDSIAICLLLGTICARFRDIAPIVGSVMQIAFFVTPIIWRKDSLGEGAVWLFLNPFYCLLTVVREPLLNQHPGIYNWIALCVWSALLCVGAWVMFARTRSRIAFWV
jgi:lipopolysaccharide transport system permease protein